MHITASRSPSLPLSSDFLYIGQTTPSHCQCLLLPRIFKWFIEIREVMSNAEILVSDGPDINIDKLNIHILPASVSNVLQVRR